MRHDPKSTSAAPTRLGDDALAAVSGGFITRVHSLGVSPARRRLGPGETVELNPQPLPPGAAVEINPQPLPPGGFISRLF